MDKGHFNQVSYSVQNGDGSLCAIEQLGFHDVNDDRLVG
jgi:hypothetical protein